MLEFHVLGSPHITIDGAVVGLQRKLLAIFVYLTLAGRGRPHRRESLLALFWPEYDTNRARRALRQALFNLRRCVGDDVLAMRGDDEVTVQGESILCDAIAFDAAIKKQDLDTAASLYQGDLLEGFYISGCPEFDQWLESQRFVRKHSYVDAVEQLAASATVTGDYTAAAQWIEKLAAHDPLNSRFAVLLMNALDAGGDRRSAIRAGERHMAMARDEFDGAVDPKVIETLDRLRASPTWIPTPNLPVDKYRPLDCSIEALEMAIGERYHILSELGRGVTSSVFLAEDRKLPRRLAIKVLRPMFSVHIGSKRFQREIKIASALSHPHIVTVIDSGDVRGYLYYVMPFIPGQSLRQKLNEHGSLGIEECVRIIKQVVKALDYSHREKIVHRDIKPENVMLHEGVVQVLDFGVALALSEAGHSRLTASGLTIGTPGYMSPEQALSDRNIDGRSDIYSVGCLLYELLTGEPVFSGVTPNAVLAKHQKQPPAPPRILRPDIPVALEHVIMTMLAKSPKSRYKTAGHLFKALEGLAPAHGSDVLMAPL